MKHLLFSYSQTILSKQGFTQKFLSLTISQYQNILDDANNYDQNSDKYYVVSYLAAFFVIRYKFNALIHNMFYITKTIISHVTTPCNWLKYILQLIFSNIHF